MKRSLLALFTFGAASAAPFLSAAADDDDASSWSLGAAFIASDRAQTGRGTQFLPVPYVAYESKHVKFSPRGLTVGFEPMAGLELALVATPRFDGFEADDSPALAGMADRNTTLEAGVSASYTGSLGTVSLTGLWDTLGQHGGSVLRLEVSRSHRIGERWVVTPVVTVERQSASFTDYYYGVRAGEATALRPAYAGGSALVVSPGVNVFYRIGGNWAAFASTELSVLPGDIKDSPIVSDSTLWSAVAGVSYRF